MSNLVHSKSVIIKQEGFDIAITAFSSTETSFVIVTSTNLRIIIIVTIIYEEASFKNKDSTTSFTNSFLKHLVET